LVFGAAVWVITWVLPLTFMAAMAWGCASHSRKLGRKAIAHWDGDATLGTPARTRGRGHSKRQIIRGGLLALATAIPIAFVARDPGHGRRKSAARRR
jgi:hypothetical protein